MKLIQIDFGTVITSAITAVFFTGGTNYVLQKKNRKGNEIFTKGYILIDEIYNINNKRIETAAAFVPFYNHPEGYLEKLHTDYFKELSAFELIVKKFSILFDKELNIKLQEYINYLREVEVALRGFMNDDPIIEVNFNQEYIERLIDEISNLIKKHI